MSEPAPLPDIEYDSEVYEPSDDTFLFIDALQDEIPFLRNVNPCISLEIGCGSGAVSTYLASSLGSETPIIALQTDINPRAAASAKRTAALNGVSRYDVVRMDLLSAFESRLKGNLDILLFNPPYVPTESEEVGSTGIEASWAGGIDGREVIDRVLPLVPRILSGKGVFYMVVVAENKPDEISTIMQEHGFTSNIVRSRKAFNERLSIMKFARNRGL